MGDGAAPSSETSARSWQGNLRPHASVQGVLGIVSTMGSPGPEGVWARDRDLR